MLILCIIRLEFHYLLWLILFLYFWLINEYCRCPPFIILSERENKKESLIYWLNDPSSGIFFVGNFLFMSKLDVVFFLMYLYVSPFSHVFNKTINFFLIFAIIICSRVFKWCLVIISIIIIIIIGKGFLLFFYLLWADYFVRL